MRIKIVYLQGMRIKINLLTRNADKNYVLARNVDKNYILARNGMGLGISRTSDVSKIHPQMNSLLGTYTISASKYGCQKI